MRFKLTWFFKTPGTGVFASAARREAARFLWRPRAWVRRIGECVMQQHDLQPRRDAQPANFVSIFIRESAEKDRELRKYNHGIVPRAAWPSVSQRVAEQLGVRRVFLQTSSASAAVAYTNATTPLGLVVSFTENRRSEHDEWGGWSNSTNAMHHPTGHHRCRQPVYSLAGSRARLAIHDVMDTLPRGGNAGRRRNCAASAAAVRAVLPLHKARRRRGRPGGDHTAPKPRRLAGAGDAACAQEQSVDAMQNFPKAIAL